MSSQALVVSPRWLGDFVMSIPLMLELDQRHDKVHCVLPLYLKELLSRLPIHVESHILEPSKGIGIRSKFHIAQKLRKHQIKEAIVIQQSLKSALLPWLARIPKRIGWLGEYRYGLINHRMPLDKSMGYLDRFASLIDGVRSEYQNPVLKPCYDQQARLMSQFSINQSTQKTLVICPGSEWESKRWRLNRFSDFLSLCHQKDWRMIVLGSQKDQGVFGSVMKKHPYAYNLLGQTSVTEALDVMDLGDLILTNDSGLMHMGRALGKPVATVYGSTSDKLTVPKSGFFRAISLNMSCLCRSKFCPLGHYKCTEDISAKHVLSEIEGLYKDAYSSC